MYVPIQAWAPDADTTQPGILADVQDMIPTVKGYAGAPSPVSIGLAALATECRGAASVTLLDGSIVLFAGTQTKLYKAGTTTWTDVTDTAGDYTGSTTSRWVFTQQGDLTLAVNKVDPSQYYLHASSTDFDALSGMPKALVVEAVGNFILIGNYNDGSDVVDGWGCSALGDYTDWTADVDTQCTYGRLYDTPGPVLGLKRLMEYAVFYKRKSMYLARYVGQPNAWEFSLISDVIGAVGQAAIERVGTTHFFLGDDNFYAYDSASIQPIGDPIKEWFNADCNNARRQYTEALHDKQAGLVYWFYSQGTATTLNAWVCYNYRNNKWGKGNLTIEAAVQYVAASLSYNDLDTRYSTYDGFPAVGYDDLNPSGLSVVPAVFNSSHTVSLLNGVTSTCSMTSSDIGEDGRISMLTRVRPRYVMSASGTMTNYYRDSPGDSLTTDATVSGGSKFDTMRSARWHRFQIEWSGNVEVTGAEVKWSGNVEVTGADVTMQAEGDE